MLKVTIGANCKLHGCIYAINTGKTLTDSYDDSLDMDSIVTAMDFVYALKNLYGFGG